MYSLLLYDLADDYLERRTPLRSAHLDLARQAAARGELVLAGALDDPADAAVVVFTSDDAARAFAEADPYVRDGLVTSWQVRRWNVVIGGGAPACDVTAGTAPS